MIAQQQQAMMGQMAAQGGMDIMKEAAKQGMMTDDGT